MARATAGVMVARGGRALLAAFGTGRLPAGIVVEPAGGLAAAFAPVGDDAVGEMSTGGGVPRLPAGVPAGVAAAFVFETGVSGGGATFGVGALAFAVVPG